MKVLTPKLILKNDVIRSDVYGQLSQDDLAASSTLIACDPNFVFVANLSHAVRLFVQISLPKVY